MNLSTHCEYSPRYNNGILLVKPTEEVVPKVDDVSLVDEVFDGTFGGDGEVDVVIGEGVVETSLSLEMLKNSCLGGMMVSLNFLEGLEKEA
nr:hypothetical protein [Tanacetum cinerariifolium]